jgi:hypothetical protein
LWSRKSIQKLPKLAKFSKNGQKWPKVAKSGQKWQNMAKNGQKRPKTAKNAREQLIIYLVRPSSPSIVDPSVT